MRPNPPQKKEPDLSQRCKGCKVMALIWNPVEDQMRPRTSQTGWNQKPQTGYAQPEKPATTTEGGQQHRTMFQGALEECHGRPCRRPHSRQTGQEGLHASDQQSHTCRLECALLQ